MPRILLAHPTCRSWQRTRTQIVSVAGSVAVGGTAGVGVGADVLSLTKDTQAYIDSGVTSHVDGDIDVSATSSEHITSVAAGVAIGGTAGVSVNAGVHVLKMTTRAYIGDDPELYIVDPSQRTPSAGAGDVHAGGTVRIAADDVTEIDKVAATVAIGGSAGVGAAATVTVVNKNTEAFIGAGAKVSWRWQYRRPCCRNRRLWRDIRRGAVDRPPLHARVQPSTAMSSMTATRRSMWTAVAICKPATM